MALLTKIASEKGKTSKRFEMLTLRGGSCDPISLPNHSLQFKASFLHGICDREIVLGDWEGHKVLSRAVYRVVWEEGFFPLVR